MIKIKLFNSVEIMKNLKKFKIILKILLIKI